MNIGVIFLRRDQFPLKLKPLKKGRENEIHLARTIKKPLKFSTDGENPRNTFSFNYLVSSEVAARVRSN